MPPLLLIVEITSLDIGQDGRPVFDIKYLDASGIDGAL